VEAIATIVGAYHSGLKIASESSQNPKFITTNLAAIRKIHQTGAIIWTLGPVERDMTDGRSEDLFLNLTWIYFECSS
jgi:hypothetical protein